MQKLFHFVLTVLLLLFSSSTLSLAQSEFKYSYIPKKIYEQQIFAVTIIGVGHSSTDSLEFNFDASNPNEPLFPKPLIVRNGADSFYTFYFKASTNDIEMPELFISYLGEEYNLESEIIKIETLKKRKDFCHVLSADMKIKSSQVSHYDEAHHIVTLSIEAYEANIEDMKLLAFEDSGVEEVQRHKAKVKAEFYFIVPIEQKEVKFTYFNTIKKQYVFLKVPVLVSDSSVVTQSDLNPIEDSFAKLKKFTFIVLVAFFLLMFLFKRDFFYLVFGVISLITLLTFYVPHKKICIEQGALLYILPTQTSTVSSTIHEEIEVMLIGSRQGFSKIQYQKGIIGWIKNENLCDH